jgi:hypothetical protein
MNAKAETTRTGSKPAIAEVLREGIRQGLLAPGQPLIQASIAEADIGAIGRHMAGHDAGHAAAPAP